MGQSLIGPQNHESLTIATRFTGPLSVKLDRVSGRFRSRSRPRPTRSAKDPPAHPRHRTSSCHVGVQRNPRLGAQTTSGAPPVLAFDLSILGVIERAKTAGGEDESIARPECGGRSSVPQDNDSVSLSPGVFSYGLLPASICGDLHFNPMQEHPTDCRLDFDDESPHQRASAITSSANSAPPPGDALGSATPTAVRAGGSIGKASIQAWWNASRWRRSPR